MTIKSNRIKTKLPKKDSKLKLWIKQTYEKYSKLKLWIKQYYQNNGSAIIIFPIIVLVSIAGVYFEETAKIVEYENKIKIIKERKPLLICNTALFCGSDRFEHYNLMKIDGNYHIEVLNTSKIHVKYIPLHRVDVVELIK